jgi:hypothetical protein
MVCLEYTVDSHARYLNTQKHGTWDVLRTVTQKITLLRKCSHFYMTLLVPIPLGLMKFEQCTQTYLCLR